MSTQSEMLNAWLNGTVNGGPNGDGRYPLTGVDGQTYLVPCPAAVAADPNLDPSELEIFVNAATQAAMAADESATDAATSAAQAKTSETSAASSATTAQTARTEAQTASTAAQTARTGADAARSTAVSSAADATAARTAAQTARDSAQDWADKEEDSPVQTGKFSARHWALKAAASAAAIAGLTWEMIAGKPVTATRWPTYAEVTGKPATFAPSAHDHTIANVTGLQAAVDAKANASASITAGNGLTGGGNFTANRTITLATPGTLSGSTTNSVSASSHTHALSANLTAWDGLAPSAKQDALGYTAANAAHSVIAGDGLSGGGTMGASRTISMGSPSTVTAESTNSTSSTGHSHNLDLRYTMSSAAAAAPVGVTVSDVNNVSGLTGATALTGWFSAARAVQFLGSPNGGSATPRAWFRTYHSSGGGGGWTAEFELHHSGNFDPSSKANTSTSISAGNGLSGGGNLGSNRTISLGTPGTLTGSTTNSVSSGSHTHALSANLTTWDGLTPSTSDDANTVPQRTGSADIYARLFRSTYADQTSLPSSSSLAFRNNNASDNYIRFVSVPSSVRDWLSLGANASFGSTVAAEGTQGPVRLIGTTTSGRSGFLEFLASNNARVGYIGYVSSSVIEYHSVGNRTHAFNDSITSTGTVSDSSGDVRKLSGLVFNATLTLTSAHLNGVVEKNSTSLRTINLPAGLGSVRDAITIVNSGTAGNINLNRASGVSLYRNGTNANVVISPGSMITIYRSNTADRWIA